MGPPPQALDECCCRCLDAAKVGDLMFLRSNVHQLGWYLLRAGVEQLSLCAARGGHLKVLQWLRLEGAPLGWQTCRGAAAGGHLVVL